MTAAIMKGDTTGRQGGRDHKAAGAIISSIKTLHSKEKQRIDLGTTNAMGFASLGCTLHYRHATDSSQRRLSVLESNTPLNIHKSSCIKSTIQAGSGRHARTS